MHKGQVGNFSEYELKLEHSLFQCHNEIYVMKKTPYIDQILLSLITIFADDFISDSVKKETRVHFKIIRASFSDKKASCRYFKRFF